MYIYDIYNCNVNAYLFKKSLQKTASIVSFIYPEGKHKVVNNTP